MAALEILPTNPGALDGDHCYRAVLGRDGRFDGRFITAVRTTGIYCRPSCPTPVIPKQKNVEFFRSTAAAQVAGYRACKRCRPDAVPGSPEWNVRADLVARSQRLITEGVVDREGVSGLARRLHVSERHLTRLVTMELGAGPLALARAQRAQTARTLIEHTALGFGDIAFASGFASVRQFNDTIREVFATTPTALRERGSRRGTSPAPEAASAGPTPISLRLAYRHPFAAAELFGFIGVRAIPGVEEYDAATLRYRRSLGLPGGPAVLELAPVDGEPFVAATLFLSSVADVIPAVSACRRLLDLDADPVSIDELFSADAALSSAVSKTPGRRSPGAVDGHELAVRAILGQQVSVVGARTLAARLVASHGEQLREPVGTVTHVFPRASVLAGISPEEIAMPRARGRALISLCAALDDGSVVLDPGVDREEARSRLLAQPGIGEWTASYIAMRALQDPDVFLAGDLGVRHGAARLGLPDTARELAEHAKRWSPWRSYAVHHLWGALS